ncbi:uncharacterized protein EDB91DRAFT_160838 [Suillus paluster]|uniref:uncharacterized protein n=1 Tax=Suillus paluster TaxID=48578 RepID=UPI001B878E9C|nr:uncharacterized protein EDB91DRAFT_160838 [Suillus paluster]KAG1723729.1 hypothetical protein EDB91DRAFT_160838 [Suillus paluster]
MYVQSIPPIILILLFMCTRIFKARHACGCPAPLLRIGPDYRTHEGPYTLDCLRSNCKRSTFHTIRVHDCRYCINELVLCLSTSCGITVKFNRMQYETEILAESCNAIACGTRL